MRRICPRSGHRTEDEFDIIRESHIEHLVAFIEDHILHFVELQGALLEQILDTTAGTHNHIHTLAQSGLLGAVGRSTVDAGGLQLGSLDHIEGLLDLHRKLARGGQHEHARGAAVRQVGAGGDGSQQALHDGQGEGQSLAWRAVHTKSHSE